MGMHGRTVLRDWVPMTPSIFKQMSTPTWVFRKGYIIMPCSHHMPAVLDMCSVWRSQIIVAGPHWLAVTSLGLVRPSAAPAHSEYVTS